MTNCSLKTRKTRGGGYSRQPSHVGAGATIARQCVAEAGEKLKKWCVLVHFGA